MKSFLEEYGFAILAAIVVILIIALCTPVGNLIKRQVMNVIDSFAGKSESRLAATDAGEEGVQIKQIDAGKIEVAITSGSTTDKFDVQYRVKADKSSWENWIDLDDLEKHDSKIHVQEYPINAQDDYSVQVRVKNIGKNDNYYMESNIIRYSANFVANSESSQWSSEDSSEFQTSLNTARANLDEGEMIQVFRGNGGTFPGGETEIWAKVRINDYTLVESYPEFSDIEEFNYYVSSAVKENFLNVDLLLDTEGLSQDEFMEGVYNGEYDVIYFDIVWEQISEDYPQIPSGLAPGLDEVLNESLNEEERIIIIRVDGGTFTNGENVIWVKVDLNGQGINWRYLEFDNMEMVDSYPYFDSLEDFKHYMWTANSNNNYFVYGIEFDRNGLPEEMFFEKFNSGEYDVVFADVVWGI